MEKCLVFIPLQFFSVTKTQINQTKQNAVGQCVLIFSLKKMFTTGKRILVWKTKDF